MDLEKLEQEKERKQVWHCPSCQGILKKHKKGTNKNTILSLGVKACHDCESTWFVQKISR